MLYRQRSEQINNLYRTIYKRNAHADEISGWMGSGQNIPTINQNLQTSFDRDGDQLAQNLRASLQIQPNTPPTTPTTPTATPAPAPSSTPSLRDQINSSYIEHYNRNADPEEIENWIGTGRTSNNINELLQRSFARDGEHLGRNEVAALQIQPNGPTLSAREQINNSYIEHYNRNADPQEIENWRGTGKPTDVIDQLLQQSFARDGEHLGQAEVAALQVQPNVPTPSEPEPNPVAVDQETQTGVVDDKQVELDGIIDALNLRIEGLEGQLQTQGTSYKDLLDSQATTLSTTLAEQNTGHQNAMRELGIGFDKILSDSTDASDAVIGGLRNDILGLNTTMSDNAAANLENIRGLTESFDTRYAAQEANNLGFIENLTNSFNDRYDTQGELYANNLSNLRTELTGAMQSQAGIYDDRILNMQNEYNTNSMAQEQRYMDNIQTMTNTHAEQQRQLRDTLNSQANPHSRQTQVGVQAPNAQGQAGAAMLQARGTKGTFNRQGLRIQGLNI